MKSEVWDFFLVVLLKLTYCPTSNYTGKYNFLPPVVRVIDVY